MFETEERSADCPLIEAVWSAHSHAAGQFTSVAVTHWEVVFTRQHGQTKITVRGPETKASRADCPADATFIGISFKHGAFLANLPPPLLTDTGLNLPVALGNRFWLDGMAWEMPTFENAEALVQRWIKAGVIDHDPLVAAVQQAQPVDLSVRTVQRRFLRATGLTQGTLAQIERARQSMALLQRGYTILDVVSLAGYADQSHLTRSVRRYIGHTPAEIATRDLVTSG